MNLAALTACYDAYVDTFRVDGVLPPMMALKRAHTAFVVKNAEAIAAGETFPPMLAAACTAAALLHDTGRYEQLKRYNTFRDRDSIDHAVFSHDIVKAQGWLLREGGCRPSEAEAVLAAVLYHNRRDVPAGLDPFTAALAHTVRDADKLDIFRVLEHQVNTTDWRHDCTAFWNLSTTARPNPAVVAAVCDGEPVDYQAIASLADFVLIQVGWMACGLRFATSRRLCAARGHLAFRRDFLHQLTDDPGVDAACDCAAAALAAP